MTSHTQVDIHVGFQMRCSCEGLATASLETHMGSDVSMNSLHMVSKVLWLGVSLVTLLAHIAVTVLQQMN